LKHHLFYPILPDDFSPALSNGVSLAETLDEWGVSATESLLAQWLPSPVGDLLAQGLLSTTITVGRSNCIDKLFKADVPSMEWRHSAAPVHIRPSAVPIEGQRLRSYAQKLRSWAIHLPESEKATLASMVSYLDSLGATIDGEAAMSPPQEALKDIKQGVLATHMKSTKEMRHLVESSVSLVMPASSVVTGLRSQQGLDRVQLQTDMAYMLAQRALSFARCMIRFGWGDSSPIGA
jgi:hypothetical protein